MVTSAELRGAAAPDAGVKWVAVEVTTMTVRSSLTVENALLAVLVAGLATFAVVHSLALFQAGSEQTRAMFRQLWFVGLVVALVPYVLIRR